MRKIAVRVPYRRHLLRVLAVSGGVLLIGALAPMGVAGAKVGLIPGTKIFIGDGSCSLGFFASNAGGDKLAVTAGHCADRIDQEVLSQNGTRIGLVVAHLGDDTKNHLYGVTVIKLYRNTAYIHDAFFTKFGNPEVGDHVRKYGARTEKTTGKVTSIEMDTQHPRQSRMESTMVGLPGDSGAAWVGTADTGGPKLLGLNIAHTTRSDGGYGFSVGFPIRALIKLVQDGSSRWGSGFIPLGA